MNTDKFRTAQNILMHFEIGDWFDPTDADYISGNISTPHGKKMCGWTVDTGGETKYGIAQKPNPSINVKELNAVLADQYYHINYWTPSKAEQLPEKLAACYYDAVVNMGTGQAGKLLQRIIGASVDGKVGNGTLTLLMDCLQTKTDVDLAKAYQQARLDFYHLIAHDKDDLSTPQNEDVHGQYERGWENRVAKLDKLLGLTGQ